MKRIYCVHATGIGGYGQRRYIPGKPLRYISHLSLKLAQETALPARHLVMKGGIFNTPERKIRNYLKENFEPGDILIAAAHSYGARDWFEGILRPLIEMGHVVAGRDWVGCVIADMEWLKGDRGSHEGITDDDKVYKAPHVDWGANFYQPRGLGGTKIKWAAGTKGSNELVEARHSKIDTSDEVAASIRKLYLLASAQRLEGSNG